VDQRHALIWMFYTCRLKDVEKRIENLNTDEDPSGWRPYYAFVDALHAKYTKNEGLQGTRVLSLSSLLCYGLLP
jgi:hypothetical protein